MSSYVLDHGTSGDIPDASRTLEFRTCVGIFELRWGYRSHMGSTDILLSRAKPFRWLCRRHLSGFAGNRKQHLALSLDALRGPLRQRGCSLLLSNALAERVHNIDDVLRLGRGPLTGDRDASLFLLEQLDDGLLVAIHELR